TFHIRTQRKDHQPERNSNTQRAGEVRGRKEFYRCEGGFDRGRSGQGRRSDVGQAVTHHSRLSSKEPIWQEKIQQSLAFTRTPWQRNAPWIRYWRQVSRTMTSRCCCPTTKAPKNSRMRRTPKRRKAPLREPPPAESSEERWACWLGSAL